MAGKFTDTHPQFTVFVQGSFAPNVDGEIEFFEEGTTGLSNRKDTYADEDLTIVNPNPMPLDGFGRSINPIFLDGSYNTVIRDVNGVQQDQVDNVQGPSSSEGVPSITVQLAVDLRPVDTDDFQVAYVIGTNTAGDGGNGHFYYDATSTESDDGKTVIEPDLGGGRWLLQNNANNTFTYSIASGTTDSFSINPTPIITTDDITRVFFVQSLGKNTVVPPQFKVGDTTIKDVTRAAGEACEEGDTGPAGYVQIIKLSNDGTEYVLSNPYRTNNDQLVDGSVTEPKIGDDAVSARTLNADTAGEGLVQNVSGALDVNPDNSTLETDSDQVRVKAEGITANELGTSAVETIKVADNAIDNTKAADMPQDTIKGRVSAGSGDPEDLTAAQVNNLLGITGTFGDLAYLDSVGSSQIDAGAVGQSEIASGAVHRAELDTGTDSGDLSTTGDVDFQIISGGEYSFLPRTEVENDPSGGQTENSFWGIGGDTNGAGPFGTQVSFRNDGSAGVQFGNFTSRFVNSSPPWDMGHGDILLFIFLRVNKDGVVTGTKTAEAPPWAYNGPTDIDGDVIVRDTSRKNTKKKMKYIQAPDTEVVIPPWRGGDPKKWDVDKFNNPEMVLVEVGQSIKNADMDIIPHPFTNLREGEHVIFIDPYDSIMDQLTDLHQKGERLGKIFREGFLTFSEPSNCNTPKDCIARKARWK